MHAIILKYFMYTINYYIYACNKLKYLCIQLTNKFKRLFYAFIKKINFKIFYLCIY
ncbi:hypothetical protein AAJ76_2700019503 [Vairimorpha ceranae]|uniref:Uncharacterized protein n=1 Tax=Vairimorpha ceranae TaxID=40302 RepID=A0A0F9WQM4_9MICR|nr:hypothetical protein AAJ76_2700019503 [Vairimorpha ceranae]KKO75238.1 hypothetical protein AAJ76_2700019503 [Vairimorpha ceranae]